MTRNPKIVLDSTLAYTTYKKMEQYRVIAMPVIDSEDKLVGIIHLHDIMRAGIVCGLINKVWLKNRFFG